MNLELEADAACVTPSPTASPSPRHSVVLEVDVTAGLSDDEDCVHVRAAPPGREVGRPALFGRVLTRRRPRAVQPRTLILIRTL